MNARQLNALVDEGHERAALLEDRLALSYATAIGRAGARAAQAFKAKVTDPDAIVAAAKWQPPLLAEVLDEQALAESARAKTKATQRSMLKAQVGEILADAGISWTVRHPLSQELLNGLAARVDDIGEGLREPVARAIANSYAQGMTVPETALAIRDAVDGLKGWQGTMLARNDLIGVSNGGGLMTARMLKAADPKSAGYKTWMSAGDGLVRPAHAAASGQTVKLDQSFSVGSSQLMYPGDPSGAHGDVVNCRCVMLFDDAPSKQREDTRRDESIQPGEAARQLLGDLPDTEALFSDGFGNYHAARQPLHQMIVKEHLKDLRRVSKPRSVFLAGGSGAGKGTVLRQLDDLPKRAAVIDPDEIKMMIPEYRDLVKAGDQYAARAVHEESSAISKQVLSGANERGAHAVIDGTGDGKPGKFAEKLQAQKDVGNRVEVIMVDTPVETALARVNSRAERTGRYVDEADVREIHRSVAASFSEYRNSVDWQVWANDDTARLIAKRVNGVETIIDRPRFQQMLDKADGRAAAPDLTYDGVTVLHSGPVDPSRIPTGAPVGNQYTGSTAKHLREIKLIPEDLKQALVKQGTKWEVGEQTVTAFPSMAHLKGVQPRGWSEGSTWDEVAGLYSPDTKTVIAGRGSSGSDSLVLHETGHALGDVKLKRTGTTVETTTEFDVHWARLYDRLDPYAQQGGGAGQQEMLAMLFSRYILKGRKAAIKTYDEAVVNWLEQIIEEVSRVG